MDTEKLLKLLNDNNVDYVIIGATALFMVIPDLLWMWIYLFVPQDQMRIKHGML